jgi:hypothetical protein
MHTARLRPTLAVAAATIAVCAGQAAAATPKTYTLRLGQIFSVSGQTGTPPGKDARATGGVVVRGRWAGGTWRVLLRTHTDTKGHYSFEYRPSRRGLLTLKVEPPDHIAQRLVLRVR